MSIPLLANKQGTRVVSLAAALLLLFIAGCASSPYGSAPVSPISVALNITSGSVEVGGTQQFSATVQNSSDLTVIWEVNGIVGGNSTVGTISNGLYTAPLTVPTPAVVTVLAIAHADSSKTASASITITPPISVTVAPTPQNVQTSQAQPFTATVANDAQNKGVTWTLSGAGCTGASCGTLSANSSASGAAITYTAPATLPSPSTVKLQATSVADSTKSASATITITAPPALAVTVAPPSASVQASGGTQSFSATVTNDAQNKGVTWILSGAGCSGASCGTLSASSSASGVGITYSAPATIPSPAAVTLTATSVADPTKSAPASITITAPPAIAVSVAPSTATVQSSGGTHVFAATVTNDPQNQGVTWALSGAGCTGVTCGTLSANSSASGVGVTYSAPSTVPSPATVSLAATSVTDPTKSAAATITVAVFAGNISVTLSPKRGGLTLSQKLNFTATVTNDVGAAGVTWSATGGGTFSNTTATTATYSAPGTAGSVTITATSVVDPTKSASSTLGVTDLPGVFTYHNDLARDGVNAQEYALTTANVAAATFGKLFSCTVDGALYAQPLWVANLTIGGNPHNAVFVATTHDTVYAFDADASPCQQLWTKSLLASGETWVDQNDVGTGDIQPDIGVIGTPVIDPATNTLYVVAKSKVSGNNCNTTSNCHQRLHALSLLDGSEPVAATDITSAISVPGTGDGSSGGNVAFNTRTQNQRPGLVLSSGVVYVAWASHGDNTPYHGWVIGFNKSTLQIVSTFNANPNGNDSGIWMSGGAPSADSGGNLYFLTGNGTFDANSGGSDYGDSTVKLSTSSGLAVAGYFTPADQQNLEGSDADHGSGGAAILVDQPSGSPHQHLVIGGGKEGNLFLLDRDNLGGYGASASPADSNAVQKFSIGNPIFSTAAFWNNALYIAGIFGPVKSFSFNTTTGLFNTAATSQSPGSNYGFPGATPSISATGSSSNGIVWALYNGQYCTQQSSACGPTVLHAYDATNLATELWNSGSTAGNAVKFTVPTIANGKVYVGTRGNNTGGAASSTSTPGELDVFGLLPN
jgi:hypothetical protein